MLVIGAARLLHVLALFLLFERVSGSAADRGHGHAHLHDQPRLPVLRRPVLVRVGGAADRHLRDLARRSAGSRCPRRPRRPAAPGRWRHRARRRRAWHDGRHAAGASRMLAAAGRSASWSSPTTSRRSPCRASWWRGPIVRSVLRLRRRPGGADVFGLALVTASRRRLDALRRQRHGGLPRAGGRRRHAPGARPRGRRGGWPGAVPFRDRLGGARLGAGAGIRIGGGGAAAAARGPCPSSGAATGPLRGAPPSASSRCVYPVTLLARLTAAWRGAVRPLRGVRVHGRRLRGGGAVWWRSWSASPSAASVRPRRLAHRSPPARPAATPRTPPGAVPRAAAAHAPPTGGWRSASVPRPWRHPGAARRAA